MAYGFEDETTRSRLNRSPAVSLSVEKRTGANIIEVVDTVKVGLQELQDRLPEGGAIFRGGVSKRSLPGVDRAGLERFAIEMFEAALDFLPPKVRLLEDQIRWSSKGLMSKVKSLPVDFRG